MLLKIATDGISVQDYVKRLKESDILVAVDGEIYRDGPAKLNEKFSVEAGDAPKWLLTFWRDGQLFDLLLTVSIQSQFGLQQNRKRNGLLSNSVATFSESLVPTRTMKFTEIPAEYGHSEF